MFELSWQRRFANRPFEGRGSAEQAAGYGARLSVCRRRDCLRISARQVPGETSIRRTPLVGEAARANNWRRSSPSWSRALRHVHTGQCARSRREICSRSRDPVSRVSAREGYWGERMCGPGALEAAAEFVLEPSSQIAPSGKRYLKSVSGRISAEKPGEDGGR